MPNGHRHNGVCFTKWSGENTESKLAKLAKLTGRRKEMKKIGFMGTF